MIEYRKALRNIREVFLQASEEEVTEGKNWYPAVYAECERLGSQYEVPVELVSDLLAVMSPAILWSRNILLAEEILVAHRRGVLADWSGDGYQKNIQKAKEILHRFFDTGEWGGILSGPKVTAFSNCILNYSRPQLPVIDVHAFSIAAGKRFTVKDMPHVTSDRRWTIQRAFTEVAESNKILPQEIQAITWLTWRRMLRKKERA